MKPTIRLFTLVAGLAISVTTIAQQAGIDSTGLPGDNFSLQGALTLFQRSASPEDFEKRLNAEDNHVNNLDLNGDGDIDYIRVIDRTEKSAHAFVLQAIVSETESQDIAVIELEKTGDTTVTLQIVGDEDIYGEEVIVEPGDGEEEAFIDNSWNNSIAHGPNAIGFSVAPHMFINVWLWPSVRFVYAPVYRPWISPWRWRYYPGWWRPWRPLAWHVWHPFHRPYYAHCSMVHTHRVVYAHNVYRPYRVTSVTVRTRHSAAVGSYRVTKTRSNVTGPSGHGSTRVRTTVNGPGGRFKTKTTIRRH